MTEPARGARDGGIDGGDGGLNGGDGGLNGGDDEGSRLSLLALSWASN